MCVCVRDMLYSVPSLAGGLFTGAAVKKTMTQRKAYGGFANAQLDPCYHQVSYDVYCIEDDLAQSAIFPIIVIIVTMVTMCAFFIPPSMFMDVGL